MMTEKTSTDEKNRLIEFSFDNKFKQTFNETSSGVFWAYLCTESYAELATKTISILLLFPIIYLCEKEISIISNLKTLKKINFMQNMIFGLTCVKLSRNGACHVKTVS